MSEKRKISIVISVYNEQESLIELFSQISDNISKIPDLEFEIIFVNDGSTDNSFNIIYEIVLHNKNVKLVNLARNFGHEVAMSAGLDYAQGDAILFMDADLQHPPELIPILIKEWLDGKDIVLTHRTDIENLNWFTKIKSRIFYKILNALSDVHIPSQFPDFRLIDKKYADVVKKMNENNRMFRGLISWLGVKNQSVIEFKAPERFAGKSKYNSRRLLSLAMDSIVSFSIKPLRIATYIGIITAIISVILGIVFMIDFLTSKTYQFTGYGTTVLMVIFIGSIQLIVMGIIGEYLGRIHLEVKNRPLYVAELFSYDLIKE